MSDSTQNTNTSNSTIDSWRSESSVKALSQILNEIIHENSEEPTNQAILEAQKKTVFNAKKPPAITIQAYMERIIKYSHLEESTLVIALIYIDRACDTQDVVLSEFNIHRYLYSSIILAIKYNEDDYYSNNYYAKIGGISLQEANRLEYEFIKLTNFNLFVTQEIFDKYHNFLLHYHVKN